MNSDRRYTQFALCREMVETADVVRRFPASPLEPHTPQREAVLLTGEGSSRIFPAKRLIADALRRGSRRHIITEGATQALEYDVANVHAYVASNSGRTAEGVRFLQRATPHATTAVVAHAGTPIADACDSAYVLGCGAEAAVAATKSVVEQALFYDAIFALADGRAVPDVAALADGIAATLAAPVPTTVIDAVTAAEVIYFAGRNDGVAEELTLKTNEITRKRSDFLEGTYAVHGIEEIMSADQVVVLVDPFPEEEEKFRTVLEGGVGMRVVAIAARQTSFPTFVIPAGNAVAPYLQLAAGWSLLAEVGIAAGIDLDTPARARKVGNEFAG